MRKPKPTEAELVEASRNFVAAMLASTDDKQRMVTRLDSSAQLAIMLEKGGKNRAAHIQGFTRILDALDELVVS